MSTYNSNGNIVKWNGADISGFWTQELTHDKTSDLTDANRGANETHKRRQPGMRDNAFTFRMYYGTTEAERAASFNLIKDGDQGTLYHAPQGEIAGQQYFEGPMIVEKKTGPGGHQERSQIQVVEISFMGDGPPVHELEDGVI